MELKKHSYTITDKMQSLSVTSEAESFYLFNCEIQDDYIKSQQNNGVDPPQIRLNTIYIHIYLKNNKLTIRDMISIIEELRKEGVLDES